MNWNLWKRTGWVAALVGLFAACDLTSARGQQIRDEEGLWTGIRAGEYFVFMRHALAPGVGDPAEFELGDCSTQRNLSEAGRRQAREIGDRFRENGIDRAAVFTSKWCRCRETAELLRLGAVTELPDLNSFFRRYERRESQTEGLKAWLRESAGKREDPLILVSHQVNITAATGTYPSSGEMVVCQVTDEGELEVVGQMGGM